MLCVCVCVCVCVCRTYCLYNQVKVSIIQLKYFDVFKLNFFKISIVHVLLSPLAVNIFQKIQTDSLSVVFFFQSGKKPIKS